MQVQCISQNHYKGKEINLLLRNDFITYVIYIYNNTYILIKQFTYCVNYKIL